MSQRILIDKTFESIDGINYYVFRYEITTKSGKKSIYTYRGQYTLKKRK